MKYFRLTYIIAGLFIFLNINAQVGMVEELVQVLVYKSYDKVQSGGEFKLAVKALVDDGWHINSNKPNEDYLIATAAKFSSSTKFNFGKLIYPRAKEINFSFSDKPVSVFEGEILIGSLVKVPKDIQPGKYKIKVTFDYQACNDVSCMAPVTVEKEIDLEIISNQTQTKEINPEVFSKINLAYSVSEVEVVKDTVTSEPVVDSQQDTLQTFSGKNSKEDSLASTLESSGIFVGLLLVFLGGLALNLTPCVYPLIPITIGYFGGQSEGRTSRLFMLGLLYVLGISITYSIVGVVTSLSGSVFGSLMQNPIVIIIIALIFLVLSLSMFGVYEFKLPDSWVAKAGGAKSGMFGAFFMGLTMGIVAAPCIGPFVLGLVTYVAAKGDPFLGFLMFFILSLGLGTPYLLLALFSGKIKTLPRAGLWMEAVKHIFGFILIGAAIYFIAPLLPKEVNFYLLPVFMIIAALYLLLFDKTANNIKGFKIFKVIFSVMVLGLAVYMLWPVEKNSPDWQKYSDQNYESSISSNQKMIIDFYADWCIPCKELDAMTFSDKRVIEALKDFTSLKVDMTKSLSDETEKVRKKFNIVGVPTVLIIDSQGKEVHRLTGFANADEFLKLIHGVN
ncbi:MAG: cytochrome c biogenesis protein CcdA [bacterium]